MVHFGNQTQVFWADAKRDDPELSYEREFWTDFFVEWSPQGHFLCSTHRQGVAMWGGPDFTRLQKLEHAGERFIQVRVRVRVRELGLGS